MMTMAEWEAEQERRYDTMPTWWWSMSNRAKAYAQYKAWHQTAVDVVTMETPSTPAQRHIAIRFLQQHTR